MSFRSRRAVGALVALALAGCAHAASAPSAAHDERSSVRAPRMLGDSHPDIRTEISTTYEVMVDAQGRADVTTLRVTGAITDPEREAIARWIAASRFTPGQQEGRPVAALYRGSLRTKVRRVKM